MIKIKPITTYVVEDVRDFVLTPATVFGMIACDVFSDEMTYAFSGQRFLANLVKSYTSRVDGDKGVFYYVEGDDPFYSRENNNVHITPAGDKICFEYSFGEGYTEKRYWTIDEYEDFAGVYSEDNDIWDD